MKTASRVRQEIAEKLESYYNSKEFVHSNEYEELSIIEDKIQKAIDNSIDNIIMESILAKNRLYLKIKGYKIEEIKLSKQEIQYIISW